MTPDEATSIRVVASSSFCGSFALSCLTASFCASSITLRCVSLWAPAGTTSRQTATTAPETRNVRLIGSPLSASQQNNPTSLSWSSRGTLVGWGLHARDHPAHQTACHSSLYRRTVKVSTAEAQSRSPHHATTLIPAHRKCGQAGGRRNAMVD